MSTRLGIDPVRVESEGSTRSDIIFIAAMALILGLLVGGLVISKVQDNSSKTSTKAPAACSKAFDAYKQAMLSEAHAAKSALQSDFTGVSFYVNDATSQVNIANGYEKSCLAG